MYSHKSAPLDTSIGIAGAYRRKQWKTPSETLPAKHLWHASSNSWIHVFLVNAVKTFDWINIQKDK